MSQLEVWASDDLRWAWAIVISDRAVEYLEGFVSAPHSGRFKTVQQHAADNACINKVGHVDRAIKELRRLGLLRYQPDGELYWLSFALPITSQPPAAFHRDGWMTERHLPPSKAGTWKVETYDLYGGVCAYCYYEEPITINESQIEHIYPYRMRGADSPRNTTIACRECNNRKRHKVPADRDYPRLRRFRGKPVLEVDFEMEDDFWYPVMTLAD